MSKFLAMLKDSLRETLDVKLLYVTVALSLLVSLFVLSVVYTPQPIEEQIKAGVSVEHAGLGVTQTVQWDVLMHLARNEDTQGAVVLTEVIDFARTDGGPADTPWTGSFEFDLSVRMAGEDEMNRRPRGGPAPPPIEGQAAREKKFEAVRRAVDREFVRNSLKSRLGFLKGLDVGEAREKSKTEVRYPIKAEGTVITTRKAWFHKASIFFGAVDIPFPMQTLGSIITFFADKVVGGFGAGLTMLLSVIMTASFLPSMLAKGSVDLLLAKPISRVTLFLLKFLGGLLFMFINTAFIMVGIWLAIGIQSGLWVNSLLVCIFVFTFQFAVFYSVSALIAIWTRSAVVSILCAVGVWALVFCVGWTHWIFIEARRNDATVNGSTGFKIYDWVKAGLPRYKDIDWAVTKMIRTDLFQLTRSSDEQNAKQEEENLKRFKDQLDAEGYKPYNFADSLGWTSVFIVLVLALACWRFAVKDY